MCFGEDALPGTFKSLQNTSSNQYFVGRLFPTISTDFFFLVAFPWKAPGDSNTLARTAAARLKGDSFCSTLVTWKVAKLNYTTNSVMTKAASDKKKFWRL